VCVCVCTREEERGRENTTKREGACGVISSFFLPLYGMDAEFQKKEPFSWHVRVNVGGC